MNENTNTQNNTTTTVSPYVLAKMISDLLGKTIQPQRIYGEVRKGKIPSTRNTLGHIEVNTSECEKWVTTYNTKKSSTPSK